MFIKLVLKQFLSGRLSQICIIHLLKTPTKNFFAQNLHNLEQNDSKKCQNLREFFKKKCYFLNQLIKRFYFPAHLLDLSYTNLHSSLYGPVKPVSAFFYYLTSHLSTRRNLKKKKGHWLIYIISHD